MKISIITVCYNSKNTIYRCVESIISQDYDDYEYIIIDGGSTDGTIEIINSYKEKIDKFISEPDGGIYEAMNKGLKESSGDWILFMNSDDILFSTETLSNASFYLRDQKVNYYGIAEVVYENIKLYEKPKNHIPINFSVDLPIHQSVFVSKYYKNKIFNIKYRISADSIFLYQLSQIARFEYIPIRIVSFALGGISSHYRDFKQYKNHLREHLDFLKIKRVSVRIKLYTIGAFTFKYIASRILSNRLYYKMVAHVAQLKQRF